jgi:hypothetical protein
VPVSSTNSAKEHYKQVPQVEKPPVMTSTSSGHQLRAVSSRDQHDHLEFSAGEKFPGFMEEDNNVEPEFGLNFAEKTLPLQFEASSMEEALGIHKQYNSGTGHFKHLRPSDNFFPYPNEQVRYFSVVQSLTLNFNR